MSKNQQINNYCAETFLNNYFYEKFRSGETVPTLELIFTPQCNLKCSYCYLWKNEKQLFSDCRASKEQVLRNLDLVMQWLEKNQFHPNLDLFSGEFFAQSLGYEALDLIYQYQSKWPVNLRSHMIVIPSNMTFVCSDELVDKVESYITKFANIGIQLVLSASFDGKLIESNRSFDDSLDIPINVVRDDAYYDKLFDYCVKAHIRFHPMIYSKHIDKWKDNYLWFKENMIKRGLSPFDFYLLEVRNEEWTIEEIKQFQDFLEFLYEELWEHCEHDKSCFVNSIWEFASNLNILGNFLYQDPNRYACSLQTSLCIRLDDLSMPPCHRTGQKQHIYGIFVPDDEKVLRFESQHLELMVTIFGLGQASLPYCTECPINHICLGQCLGAMYESNKNLFVPIPSVCSLEHAKLITAIKCFIKYDVFDMILNTMTPDKAFQFEKLKEAIQC